MIIKAREEDLLEAMYIYSSSMREMNQRGLFNWNTAYPSREIVLEDIREGNLFLIRKFHNSIGAMCLNESEPEEYAELDWNYKGKYLVVHRLAVYPQWRNMKIAGEMMTFALDYARDSGYDSIRLDAITSNPQAVRIYERCGFEPVGEIHFSYQKDAFRCMEIKLKT